VRKHLTWILPVGILGVIIYYLYDFVQAQPIPRSVRLTDCTNSALSFRLTIPKGRGFSMVLAAPETGEFSGRVRIADQSPSVVEFPIGSGKGAGVQLAAK
jgi:hypothetical protein